MGVEHMLRRFAVPFVLCATILFYPAGSHAEGAPAGAAAAALEKGEGPARKVSPWLVVPTLSSNPKLGTSFGAMVGYLHYFDERSKVSMFGAAAQYTSTDSTIGALFAKTSTRADHHRVTGLAASGLIKNDYSDFLGTGKPLQTEDDLSALVGRYLYRVKDDWFAGAQALYTNYQMIGQTALDDQVLNILGLQGFRSGGIGAVAMHDSRDSEYSPKKGWFLNLNNIAYRDWISGD